MGAISSALALASAAAIASPSATLISASFEYLAKPAMASASVTPDLITSLPRYFGNRLSVLTLWFRVRVRVRVRVRGRVRVRVRVRAGGGGDISGRVGLGREVIPDLDPLCIPTLPLPILSPSLPIHGGVSVRVKVG